MSYAFLYIYFPKCFGHTSSNTGLITGWEVFIGLTVYTSKNRELPFIFVVLDQSLLPALPNYRKNCVWSRKLVLWIHISFVGQWSSCMWHDFCWHIMYSLFSFLFFQCQRKTVSIHCTSGEGWWRFLRDLGRVISPPSVAVSSSTTASSNVQQLYGFVAAQLFSHLIKQICFYDKGKDSLSSLFILCSGSNVDGWS